MIMNKIGLYFLVLFGFAFAIGYFSELHKLGVINYELEGPLTLLLGYTLARWFIEKISDNPFIEFAGVCLGVIGGHILLSHLLG